MFFGSEFGSNFVAMKRQKKKKKKNKAIIENWLLIDGTCVRVYRGKVGKTFDYFLCEFPVSFFQQKSFYAAIPSKHRINGWGRGICHNTLRHQKENLCRGKFVLAKYLFRFVTGFCERTTYRTNFINHSSIDTTLHI